MIAEDIMRRVCQNFSREKLYRKFKFIYIYTYTYFESTMYFVLKIVQGIAWVNGVERDEWF